MKVLLLKTGWNLSEKRFVGKADNSFVFVSDETEINSDESSRH